MANTKAKPASRCRKPKPEVLQQGALAAVGAGKPAAYYGDMPLSSTLFPVNARDGRLHYWPCELLHVFTLEMAARGVCVNEAMMLGDSVYARQKLSQATALHEPALDQLVRDMLDYFEPHP